MAIYVSGIICQDVLKEEATGAYSAIRIADRLTVNIPIGVDPKSLPQAEANVLVFYRSEEPEQFATTIRVLNPDLETLPPRTDEVQLRGGTRGHMSHITLQIQAAKAGTWWIEVLVKQEIALRIPFEVIHTPQNAVPTPLDQPHAET